MTRRGKITESRLFISNIINCSYLSIRQKLIILAWITTDEPWLNLETVALGNRIAVRPLINEVKSLLVQGHLYSMELKWGTMVKMKLNGGFIREMVNKSDR